MKLLKLLLVVGILSGVAWAVKSPYKPWHKDSNAANDPRTWVLCYQSAASAGGAATEALAVSGLLASDSIVSVSQKSAGANGMPLLGYDFLGAGSLTGIWSVDPGAGAVLHVCVGR